MLLFSPFISFDTEVSRSNESSGVCFPEKKIEVCFSRTIGAIPLLFATDISQRVYQWYFMYTRHFIWIKLYPLYMDKVDPLYLDIHFIWIKFLFNE